jgi:hypothetical protein
MQYVKYVFVALLAAGLLYVLLLATDIYNPEVFAGIAGMLLAGIFEYFPWVHDDYNNLPDDLQRLVMIGAVFVVVAFAFLFSCLALIVAFACTGAGAQDALIAFVLAISSSQIAHRILPRAGFTKRLARS